MFLAAEQARLDRIELGPQLAEMVLQRRAGHRDALACIEFAHELRGLALRVLDRLRLVEHEHRIRMSGLVVNVPGIAS